MSFVFAGTHAQLDGLSMEQLVSDGNRWDTYMQTSHGVQQYVFDRSMMSSVGIGSQIYCGRTSPYRNNNLNPPEKMLTCK